MTSLARCVGDTKRFLDHHWGRAPLHRVAADENGFGDLFSLDDVDHLVSSTSPRLPAFRLVRDGRPLEPSRYTRTARIGGRTVSGVGDPRRVFEEFHGGATIVLQGLQRYWPPLTRFCRSLELELTHAVQANAYVTPPRSRGLGVHYDTHDVFVLQLAGRKAWDVYPPVLADPLPSQLWSSDRGAPGAPCLSAEVKAGDCLYMPRGYLHSAQAQQELSAHLTIGVPSHTRHDVAKEVLGGTADDAWFRGGLAPGWAEDVDGLADEVRDLVRRLREWLDTLDADAVARRVATTFWKGRPPMLSGQLRQLLVLEQLGDGSVLRRRDGTVCRLSTDREHLRVLLGDRELRMPAVLAPVMHRIAAEGGPFPVSALADELDEPSRLVLARRLVREGLLEIVTLG
ncbi:MAG TPA: cupin domain-containing protein [Acidimicrobiales bacterium]|nr:cupin domain-containing protein [Acidimicrobiales bacterium]